MRTLPRVVAVDHAATVLLQPRLPDVYVAFSGASEMLAQPSNADFPIPASPSMTSADASVVAESSSRSTATSSSARPVRDIGNHPMSRLSVLPNLGLSGMS